ncbi:MAG TPA: ABC transporter permease [Acidobacteriaceae bacterium]|jgi:predicted permease|nr:ABC transporter permease [Acidobacteriaceae bacterium]
MPTLLQDIRYALRKLRHSPGFALTAIVTLALGIGANVVVFSVLNALLLRPMNFRDAKHVFMLQHPHEDGFLTLANSYPDYKDLRDRNITFSALAMYNFARIGLETSNGPQPVWGYMVSGNYFDMLGVRPYLGRMIHQADDTNPGASAYVVLSYNCWRSKFGSDKGIVGRVIHLNKVPYTVLGVAPRGFTGTERFVWPDVFVPVMNQAQIEGFNWIHSRDEMDVFLVGRVKPGITAAAATANLNAVAHQLAKEYPQTESKLAYELTQPGFLGNMLGGPVKAFLLGVMLLAGLVLLAACANLGSLFAARTADRARELAIRVAVGAGRSRLLRQLLTESIVLSILGGMAGCVVAVGLLHALSNWQPTTAFPIQVVVEPDKLVYFFAFVVSVATGALFGCVPLRQIWKTDPNQAIKSGTSTMQVGRTWAFRDLLLGFQIAICCLLVTASLVALRGLGRTLHANFGFNPNGVTVAAADLQLANYTAVGAAQFQKRLAEEVAHLPGVTAVGYTSATPLSVYQSHTSIYTADTVDLNVENTKFGTNYYRVSPGYLTAAGTRIVAGRNFTEQDDAKAPRVAIINQTFARMLFGTTDAVGKYMKAFGDKMEIIGVVEDGKYNTISEDPSPALFLSILQRTNTSMFLLVRSQRDPRDMAVAVHDTLRRLDPNLPISSLGPWQDALGLALMPARVATLALGAFGGLGILLAITGIFGLASYTVSRRMKELGIRVALGASRGQLLRAALYRPMVLLLSGSLVGLALGIAASRVLASIVYQATPNDPVVLAGVVLTMMLVGTLATWIPARRALQVDPKQILREE